MADDAPDEMPGGTMTFGDAVEAQRIMAAAIEHLAQAVEHLTGPDPTIDPLRAARQRACRKILKVIEAATAELAECFAAGEA